MVWEKVGEKAPIGMICRASRENLQGCAKEMAPGCEIVLPGCAWLMLSKTAPFSAQACKYGRGSRIGSMRCALQNKCKNSPSLKDAIPTLWSMDG